MAWEDIVKQDEFDFENTAQRKKYKDLAKKMNVMQNQLMHKVGVRNIDRAIEEYNQGMKDMGEHGDVTKLTASELLQFIGKVESGFNFLATMHDDWPSGRDARNY